MKLHGNFLRTESVYNIQVLPMVATHGNVKEIATFVNPVKGMCQCTTVLNTYFSYHVLATHTYMKKHWRSDNAHTHYMHIQYTYMKKYGRSNSADVSTTIDRGMLVQCCYVFLISKEWLWERRVLRKLLVYDRSTDRMVLDIWSNVYDIHILINSLPSVIQAAMSIYQIKEKEVLVLDMTL